MQMHPQHNFRSNDTPMPGLRFDLTPKGKRESGTQVSRAGLYLSWASGMDHAVINHFDDPNAGVAEITTQVQRFAYDLPVGLPNLAERDYMRHCKLTPKKAESHTSATKLELAPTVDAETVHTSALHTENSIRASPHN